MTTDIGEPLGRVNESLEDRVAERLRWMIAADRIPEETRLRQRPLAEQLGVSQTPVRNSLNRLVLDGFVEVGVNGHVYVRRRTFEDLEELSAARIGLEGLAMRLGAPRVKDAVVAQMEECLPMMERHAADNDLEQYLLCRWRFHAACYNASGRTRLVEKVERLFLAAARYNVVLLRLPAAVQESLGNYRAILEAVRNRDGDAAHAAFVASADWAVNRARGVLPHEEA